MMTINDNARDEHSGIITIIGIGQSLRGDDAAGLAAVHLWQETYQDKAQRSNLQVELAELPGIGLLNLLEGTRIAILVDAVRSDAKPGTVHILSGDQLEAFASGSGSAHGWGMAETLALGQRLMPSTMPQKLFLIGIEAGDISLGESLSSEVELALPQAALFIELLVASG
jgi:hydrogenase maturation protease